MSDTKLYVPPSRSGWPTLHLVTSFRGQGETGSTLFTNNTPKGFEYRGFTFVEKAEESDFILAPHPISRLDERSTTYVEEMKEIAASARKKLILFIGSDLSHDVFVDGVIALKGSQYGYLRKDNEYTVVPFAEDLSEVHPFTIRTKSEKPSVSFCGWAGFATPDAYIKYLIRNTLIEIQALLPGKRHLRVRKKGLYWRRKAMQILKTSPRIQTNFIVRSTFSASAKTISLDPAIARAEYIENLAGSDFVLAPKGDGNFSVRFYEALSLGRIPILIDTDMVLPLEGILDFSRFTLQVSYKDIHKLDEIVADFYAGRSEEEFADMQKAARAAYTEYLRYDRFFENLFTKVLPPSVS